MAASLGILLFKANVGCRSKAEELTASETSSPLGADVRRMLHRSGSGPRRDIDRPPKAPARGAPRASMKLVRTQMAAPAKKAAQAQLGNSRQIRFKPKAASRSFGFQGVSGLRAKPSSTT
jgi:hypothetical protein